jgi:septum formation protein
VILASLSPRRRYLLRLLLKNFDVYFTVKPSKVLEVIPAHLTNYSKFVRQLALDKALESATRNNGIIIGADTIVVFDGRVIGKPSSKTEARKMLSILSGNTHSVYTGIAIVNTYTKQIFIDYEVTKVKFRHLKRYEINYYVATGSPFDKAGAYGIQDDFGSTFVEKITGDYFNVVGLPVMRTYLGLRKFLELKGKT